MPVNDDDLHAQEPTPVDSLEAKAAAARAESEGPEFAEQTPEPIGDEEPADAVDDSDPDSPNAE